MLCDVGDGAGFGNNGWSDAISMQTWPSKELTVCGYEVKATRSDWLRELNSPSKNRAWQDQCHEWYIVAPKDVVKLEELPTSWGLMVPVGADKLRIASRSERPGRDTVDLDLLAAVFRAAGRELTTGRDRARLQIREQVREELVDELAEAQREQATWKRQYEELATALGSRWDSVEELKGRAIAIRDTKPEDIARRVRSMRIELESTAKRLTEVEAALQDGHEVTP
jgi:Arc/MetJ family transcription regulator